MIRFVIKPSEFPGLWSLDPISGQGLLSDRTLWYPFWSTSLGSLKSQSSHLIMANFTTSEQVHRACQDTGNMAARFTKRTRSPSTVMTEQVCYKYHIYWGFILSWQAFMSVSQLIQWLNVILYRNLYWRVWPAWRSFQITAFTGCWNVMLFLQMFYFRFF